MKRVAPFKRAGSALGFPAVTSRGFVEADMLKVAKAINPVLDTVDNETTNEEAKSIALALCEQYPLPY